MLIPFVVLTVVVGLVIGSFLNVVVLRTHEGIDFVAGRSECPHCRHELAARDLFPLFSWLLLRGKCRYCKHPISAQYPLVEALTAVLFTLAYVTHPVVSLWQGILLVIWLYVIAGMIILAVSDVKWHIIPDKVQLPLLAAAGLIISIHQYLAEGMGTNTIVGILAVIAVLIGVYMLLGEGEASDSSEDESAPSTTRERLESLLWFAFGVGVLYLHSAGYLSHVTGPVAAGFLVSGFFLILATFSNGTWMGGGDVKLALTIGLLLGIRETALAMFVAFNAAAIIGVTLIASKRKGRGDHIPFGPFLIAGTLVAYFFGTHIISWYLHDIPYLP